jgi:murein DD-endopeptidase MepM/ murein hydrolase activator NlpD
MHTGLDLSAPFKSPVYNTAPGTVIFAGAKGEYGRVVDIDHGSGIVTRYAHLHRIMVVKGQHLAGREQIGQLGSSGRSTGPHVHYEVQVNGVPQDPEKFLQAGNIVQISGK